MPVCLCLTVCTQYATGAAVIVAYPNLRLFLIPKPCNHPLIFNILPKLPTLTPLLAEV